MTRRRSSNERTAKKTAAIVAMAAAIIFVTAALIIGYSSRSSYNNEPDSLYSDVTGSRLKWLNSWNSA